VRAKYTHAISDNGFDIRTIIHYPFGKAVGIFKLLKKALVRHLEAEICLAAEGYKGGGTPSLSETVKQSENKNAVHLVVSAPRCDSLGM
jgi:hypothetical protein